MNDNNTLEVQLKTSMQELDKAEQGLSNTLKQVIGNVKQGLSEVTNLNAGIKNLNTSTSKLGNNLKTAFSFGILASFGKRAVRNLWSMYQAAVDYSEELNLFNVVFKNFEESGTQAFSEVGKEAIRFQNRLNEAFGTNQKETLRYQALYQSMAENAGISPEAANLMSKTMTKLTYDLSSLYNKNEQSVAEALRAGVYAGQTKPLRGYGIDVTQTTMEPVLQSLGITDRSVKELTQAEKEILRYIATLRQAKVAMGDFANTIESPANQLKVLRQQFVELKVAVGNLFQGVLQRILPYANAIIMVIKEIAKALAGFFGIQVSDFNTGIATAAETFEDVGEAAGSATGKVKELKRQTLGFDQINNLTSPSSSGSGSGGGGGVSGGIDQRLLDAIQGYDNGMDRVRMKAVQIRDQIMQWLGFHKEIDPLTGKITWRYGGFGTTLKNMIGSFSKLNPLVKVLIGYKLADWFIRGSNAIKGLVSGIGSSGLFKWVKNLVNPYTQLVGITKDMTKETQSLTQGLSQGFNMWQQTLTGVERTKLGLLGLLEVAAGMSLLTSSFRSIAEEGLNLGNAFQGLGGIISSAIGGASTEIALFGSAFGPLGALAGAAVGVVTSFVGSIIQHNAEVERAREKIALYGEAVGSLSDAKLAALEGNMAEITYYQNLASELEGLIDSNGRVKEGYEDRANFILTTLNDAFGTEYQLTGNQITLNGQAVTSYGQINNEINKKIALLKVEAYQSAFREDYNNAIKREAELTRQVNDETARHNEELRKIQEEYDKLEAAGKLTDEAILNLNTRAQREIKNHEQKVQELDAEYNKNKETIKRYEEVATAAAKGSIEEINAALQKHYGSAEEAFKKARTTMEQESNSVMDTIGKIQQRANNTKIDFKISGNFSAVDNGLNQRVRKTYYSTIYYKSAGDLPVNNSYQLVPRADGGVYKNGRWMPITQYANGGLPSTGQLFMAREAGPELVGKIGNSTAVMNNNQIVSSVAAGVYQAVTNAMANANLGGGVELYVHSDEGVVIDKINKITKQTGSCPIEI